MRGMSDALTRLVRAPIGNVIVGTDFTRHARDAAARAAWLPLGAGCDITLVHTVPAGLPAHIEVRLSAAARGLMESAQALIEQEARRAGRPLPPVFTAIETGHPAEHLAELARHRRAELLVIGHGERRSAGERILGSTAERVVRVAGCSVLVVAAAPVEPYRHPLVGVDLSDSSKRAVELASRLLAPDVTTLDILHIYDTPYIDLLQSGGMTPAEVERYLAGIEQSSHRLLTSWIPALRELGVEPQPRLRRGSPRQVLIEEVVSHGADLVGVGHRSRSTLGTLLLGSVAEAVVRRGPCDVLVVR
jgi:nucleotide-binding universal stress UspA family protein